MDHRFLTFIGDDLIKLSAELEDLNPGKNNRLNYFRNQNHEQYHEQFKRHLEYKIKMIRGRIENCKKNLKFDYPSLTDIIKGKDTRYPHLKKRWIKRLNGLNKNFGNGYSLLGDFVNLKSEELKLICGVYIFHEFRLNQHQKMKRYIILFDHDLNIFHENFYAQSSNTWAKKLWTYVEDALTKWEDPLTQVGQERIRFVENQRNYHRAKMLQFERELEKLKAGYPPDPEFEEWLNSAAVLGGNDNG